jgi:hypothetical protein
MEMGQYTSCPHVTVNSIALFINDEGNGHNVYHEALFLNCKDPEQGSSKLLQNTVNCSAIYMACNSTRREASLEPHHKLPHICMQNTNGVYMETQQAVSTRYQTIPV